MGSTITYTVRKQWRNNLISTLTEFKIKVREEGIKSISKPDLRNVFELSDDMITFFENIKVINNVAKIKGGRKGKRGTYTLTDTSYEILDLFENESEHRLSLFLHKLLLDNFFQYEYFLDFFKEIYLKTLSEIDNLKLEKKKIRNNFLDFCENRFGTSEFIDKHTFSNIYYFATGVNLLQERNDQSYRINSDFFEDINYKKLNILIETQIKSYSEGILTRKLCENLKKNQKQFYYGKDLTINEIYELILNIYLRQIEEITPNFDFSGGVPRPPIPSPHTIIKYKSE